VTQHGAVAPRLIESAIPDVGRVAISFPPARYDNPGDRTCASERRESWGHRCFARTWDGVLLHESGGCAADSVRRKDGCLLNVGVGGRQSARNPRRGGRMWRRSSGWARLGRWEQRENDSGSRGRKRVPRRDRHDESWRPPKPVRTRRGVDLEPGRRAVTQCFVASSCRCRLPSPRGSSADGAPDVLVGAIYLTWPSPGAQVATNCRASGTTHSRHPESIEPGGGGRRVAAPEPDSELWPGSHPLRRAGVI